MLDDFRLAGTDLGSEVWRARGDQRRCQRERGITRSDGGVRAGLQGMPEIQRMGTPCLARGHQPQHAQYAWASAERGWRTTGHTGAPHT
jgi:hypothetical protein